MVRTLRHLARIPAIASSLLMVAGVPLFGSNRAPIQPPAVAKADTAVFAGGCFWGIEAVFEHVQGVTSAVSGYAGGTRVSPAYVDVSTGTTRHAESAQVIGDPATIPYSQLGQVFFMVAHHPTQLNRQGPDDGTQYRSAVFYRSAEQKQAAQAYIAELERSKAFSRPIVTVIAPLAAFYPAESYHQDYLQHHPNQPYIVVNDAPKLVHLQQQFPALYRGS